MPRKRRQTSSRPKTAFLDCLNVGGGIALLNFMAPDDAPEFALVCREARAAVARHPWAVAVRGDNVAAATAARPAARALTVSEAGFRAFILGASPAATPVALAAALGNLTSSLASLTLECCVAPAALAAALAGPLRRLQVLQVKGATQPPSYLSFPSSRFRRSPLVLDLRWLRRARLLKLTCNIGRARDADLGRPESESDSESDSDSDSEADLPKSEADDLATLANSITVLEVRALRPLTFGDRQAAPLSRVTELALEGEFAFAATPAALAALTQLRTLRLTNTRLAPAQADELGGAPGAPAGARARAAAAPEPEPCFGAAHLRALALTQFEARDCPGACATDDWFAALASTPSVSLRIDIAVTAAAFAHLAGSARLHLAGLDITDAALADLRSAAHLTLVGCDVRAVTAAGLRAPPLTHLRTDDPRLYRVATGALPGARVSLISNYDSD